MSALRAKHRIGLVAAAFAVVCVTIVAWWPPMTFWSPDCAAKFLQSASVRYSGGLRYDVPYLGKSFDPGMHAIPIGETYFDLRGGEIHIAWPELFALLSHPFYVALGWFGLFVVPIAAGVASVCLAGVAAERIRAGTGWMAAAIVAATTPVLIYSVLFWEHTLALSLVLLALVLAIGYVREGALWRIVVAAALVGFASSGVRGDVILYVPALVAGVFFATRGRSRWWAPPAAALGYALGSAPAWAVNRVVNGSLAPSNAVKNVPFPTFEYLRTVHVGIVPHFLAGKTHPAWAPWVTTLAVCALVMGALAGRRRAGRWGGFVLLASAVALAVASLAEMMATHDDRFHGWLAMCPVLALGLLRSGPRLDERSVRAERAVLLATIFYGAAVALAIGATYPEGFANDGNQEWGPRYWLPIFPLAAVLVAVNHDALLDWLRAAFGDRLARPLAVLIAGSLAAIGLAFNALGLARIDDQLRDQGAIRAELHHVGSTPLLTDVFFVSSLDGGDFFRRPSFYVRFDAPERFSPWLSEAFAHGLRSFVFATFRAVDGHPFFLKQPHCSCVLTIDGEERYGDLRLVHLRAVPRPATRSAVYAGHAIRGEIYARYAAIGGESSYLGLPLTDELPSSDWCQGGRYNLFEHGRIDWCPDVGAWAHNEPHEGYPGRDR